MFLTLKLDKLRCYSAAIGSSWESIRKLEQQCRCDVNFHSMNLYSPFSNLFLQFNWKSNLSSKPKNFNNEVHNFMKVHRVEYQSHSNNFFGNLRNSLWRTFLQNVISLRLLQKQLLSWFQFASGFSTSKSGNRPFPQIRISRFPKKKDCKEKSSM